MRFSCISKDKLVNQQNSTEVQEFFNSESYFWIFEGRKMMGKGN